MWEKSSTFAPDMRIYSRMIALLMLCVSMQSGCRNPSSAEAYRLERLHKDSIALEEQRRSMTFYQSQLDSLMPVADSLIAFFRYEKNDRYQDHGYYVVRNEPLRIPSALRILVRDDGGTLLVYRDGKRIESSVLSATDVALPALARAEHLQAVIADIKELEKRIGRTSLEIQKYERRYERNQHKETPGDHH